MGSAGKAFRDKKTQIEKLYLEDIKILSKNKAYKEILEELKISRIYTNILKLEEEAVLRFYTTNTGYKFFNQALRGEIKMTSEFLTQERLINNALSKLPNYQSNSLLYRIEYLTEKQIDDYYKIGKEITNKHFTPDSADLQSVPTSYITI